MPDGTSRRLSDLQSPPPIPRPEPDEPINVVLITLDTTRADALGSYGQRLNTSPNLDRLAREGTQFLQCLSSAPTTLPSHATIFTGKQPYVHGARSNAGFVLSRDNETLAEVFGANGYETAAEVAGSVINARTQLDQGFDRYRDLDMGDIERKRVTLNVENGRTTVEVDERDAADVTAHGIRFIRSHRSANFFLWLHYFDAHQPYSPPPRDYLQMEKSSYHGEVHYVDDQIGRFISQVEAIGLRDETLVVITADHGESLGQHDESSHSYFVYDTTIHVPLIMWGARVPAGLKVDALVRTVDIAPTILDLVGLPPLDGAQGVSLKPLLEGETNDLGLVAYGETSDANLVFGASMVRFLRDGRWKYIHKAKPELYDVVADPGELENLAATRPDVVEHLRSEMETLLSNAAASPTDAATAIDAETAARLESLGYAVSASAAPDTSALDRFEPSGRDPSELIEDIVLMGHATGYSKTERYEEAAEVFRKLAERNPNSAILARRQLVALEALGRDAEREEVLQRLLAIEPGNSDTYVQLAQLKFERGDADDARELLDASLAVEPCAMGARATLAHLAAQGKEFGRQLQLLREGVEGCDLGDDFLNSYAYALATAPEPEQRDGPEALRIAQRITEAPEGKRPEYLDTLAAAYAETGAFADAVQAAERALALVPPGEIDSATAGEIRAHLALFEAGRPARAE